MSRALSANRVCGIALAACRFGVVLLIAVIAPGVRVHAQDPTPPAKDITPLHFEPQDWSTPKDAWLINKSTESKWNLWSGDKDAAKRWTGGVVLQSPPVLKDRATPEEGAPPLRTRITGIPSGRYDVSIKAARTLGVSLDGKTWRRYTHGPIAENVLIADGVFEVWVDDRYADPSPGPCYYDQVTLTPRVPSEDGVANPRFVYRHEGQPLGWNSRGHFKYDEE